MTRVVMLQGGSPWGLTLSGGKDFGTHLQISKLTPGGKAQTSGIREREYIVAINGEDAVCLSHHEAQQRIKFSGKTLSLKLMSDKPAQNVITAKPAPPTKVEASHVTDDKPKAPPIPSAPQQDTPPPAPIPVHQRPVYKTSAVSDEPPAPASTIVPDSGLYSGQQSTIQSPAFKKITVEQPSILSPKSAYTPPPANVAPPTKQMERVGINDGNVIKTPQRPKPPSNAPTQFNTTTMKVQSDTGPKGQSPFAKPAPPPAVRSQPSPVSQPAPSPSGGSVPLSPSSKIVSRQGICEACKQPIRGAYASALGKTWHPDHFVCSRCGRSLSNTTFVFEEDKIFCDSCYTAECAKICFQCRRPIVGQLVNAADRQYHSACFKCSKCFVDLTTQNGFNMEHDTLFCADCYSDAYGAVCFGCNNKIGGNDLWVEAMDHDWHPQCFVCDGCKRPLEGGKFFTKVGRPFCGQCA